MGAELPDGPKIALKNGSKEIANQDKLFNYWNNKKTDKNEIADDTLGKGAKQLKTLRSTIEFNLDTNLKNKPVQELWKTYGVRLEEASKNSLTREREENRISGQW